MMPSEMSSRRNKLINKKFVQSNSVDQLAAIVNNEGREFNAVNAATACHKLAKLVATLPQRDLERKQQLIANVLDSLKLICLQHVSEFQGQGLGIVLWSFAKISQRLPWPQANCSAVCGSYQQLLRAFTNEVVRRLENSQDVSDDAHQLGPQSLSNVVYSCAVLQFSPGQEAMEKIGKGIVEQISNFLPQGLSNVIWGYAKLHVKLTPEVYQLFQGISAEAIEQLTDRRSQCLFIPQNLSNLLYGLAIIGFKPGTALLDAIVQESDKKLQAFQPQELINLVWSYAKMNSKGPHSQEGEGFLQRLFKESYRQLQLPQQTKFRPQTLANLLWSFASLGIVPEDQQAVSAILCEALVQLQHFKTQEIASALWALAQLELYPGEDAMNQFMQHVYRVASFMKPQELANTIWACATLRHFPGDELLVQLASVAEEQLSQCKSAEIGRIMSSLARLTSLTQVSDQRGALNRLCRRCASVLVQRRGGIKVSDQCSAIWGLIVMNQVDQEIASTLHSNVVAYMGPQLGTQSLVQVMEFALYVKMHGFSSLELHQYLPDQIFNLAEVAYRQQIINPKRSLYHSQVIGLLQQLGIPFVEDQLTADGELQVEVAISLPGRQIALEIGKQKNFTVNPPHMPLGKVLLRWRMLTALGWEVVQLPFYALTQLESNESQLAYLQAVLQPSPKPNIPCSDPLTQQIIRENCAPGTPDEETPVQALPSSPSVTTDSGFNRNTNVSINPIVSDVVLRNLIDAVQYPQAQNEAGVLNKPQPASDFEVQVNRRYLTGVLDAAAGRTVTSTWNGPQSQVGIHQQVGINPPSAVQNLFYAQSDGPSGNTGSLLGNANASLLQNDASGIQGRAFLDSSNKETAIENVQNSVNCNSGGEVSPLVSRSASQMGSANDALLGYNQYNLNENAINTLLSGGAVSSGSTQDALSQQFNALALGGGVGTNQVRDTLMSSLGQAPWDMGSICAANQSQYSLDAVQTAARTRAHDQQPFVTGMRGGSTLCQLDAALTGVSELEFISFVRTLAQRGQINEILRLYEWLAGVAAFGKCAYLRTRQVFHAMVTMCVLLNHVLSAAKLLQDLRLKGLAMDAELYETVSLHCLRAGYTSVAVELFALAKEAQQQGVDVRISV